MTTPIPIRNDMNPPVLLSWSIFENAIIYIVEARDVAVGVHSVSIALNFTHPEPVLNGSSLSGVGTDCIFLGGGVNTDTTSNPTMDPTNIQKKSIIFFLVDKCVI